MGGLGVTRLLLFELDSYGPQTVGTDAGGGKEVEKQEVVTSNLFIAPQP